MSQSDYKHATKTKRGLKMDAYLVDRFVAEGFLHWTVIKVLISTIN